MRTETIRFDMDADGVVTLTLDDPQQSANTMRPQFVEDFAAMVDHLVAMGADLRGVLLRSAKSTFFAGGDLKELQAAGPADAPAILALTGRVQRAMIALETLGKPVVAVLQGSALGGGLELALACHHRVAVRNPKARFGLPEVSLGLLPGGGGIVRTVRMFGVVDALMKLLLKGPQLKAEQALELGLIDALEPDLDAALSVARAFIQAHPQHGQPWRAPGYRIPGGAPGHPKLAQTLPVIPATLKSQFKGAHYDAPHHIVTVAVESAQVEVDRAFELEARAFVDLVCHSAQSKNMTQAFFFDLQAINRGGSRPAGHPQWSATRVGILGAGMMGAGIAWQCARSGIAVVLKDLTLEGAEKGKTYSQKLADKAVSRGKMSPAEAAALLDRIQPTASPADLAGCDLVIEAVFESPALKKQVFGEVTGLVAPDALLASNTSTLPISELASGVDRPQDFVGLHFFSPVDKMPLVEIIRGRQTSDAALAKALDFVLQIKRTPIVVNDGRGFFTSRVIGAFLHEALAALGEGISPVMIERAGLAAGYPAPPLQLIDELTLTLPSKILAEYRANAEATGQTWQPHPAEAVLARMLAEGRTGRSGGAGFYGYGADGLRTGLWEGLAGLFGSSRDAHRQDDDDRLFLELQERMLYAEAIETVKCFDEGVLTTFPDANIGSILGIGFPAWTGGVAQYIDQTNGGTPAFVARARALAQAHGARFLPPPSLVAKAEAGAPFRPAPTPGG